LIEGLRAAGLSVEGISLGGVPNGLPGIATMGARFFASRTFVHYHTDEGNHRWMRLLSRWWQITRTPYVVTVHSFRHRPEFEDARVMQDLVRAYRGAKAVIAISEETARDLELRLGFRHQRTRVIPSALPMSSWERTSPLPSSVADRWQGASIRLLANAGRVVRFNGEDLYGIDVLVAALGLVPDADVALCIAVGDVVDADLWTTVQEAIARDPRITVVRDLAGPLAPFVERSHIVVRPTRTEGGPSLTLSEALECGRWAVGSDAVQRPDGTVLFRSGDATSLAATLRRCIDDVRRGAMPPAVVPNVDAIARIVNLYERVR
jgi:glycosyltransferase involved in cell wall biosynthesis